MDQLTSKEGVLMAIRHEEPDRVPINYKANSDIDRRLKKHYGLSPDDGEGLRDILGVDYRGIVAQYAGPRLHEEPDEPAVRVSPDWGMRTRYMEHETGGYWEPYPGRLKHLDEEMAAEYPMPSPEDYDYSAVKSVCEKNAQYAVMAYSHFEVMNWTARHVGDEKMYVGLGTGDPAVMTLINRFVERYDTVREYGHY